MDFYPVLPAGAIPGAGDGDGTPPGIVAVRPGDLRRPRWGAVSALVAGTAAGRPVTRGEPLVFCHQVAVAPAVVRRSGEVQAGGWLFRLLRHCGQLRAVPAGPGCGDHRRRTKGALGLEFGPSSDGEQTLTRRLVR